MTACPHDVLISSSPIPQYQLLVIDTLTIYRRLDGVIRITENGDCVTIPRRSGCLTAEDPREIGTDRSDRGSISQAAGRQLDASTTRNSALSRCPTRTRSARSSRLGARGDFQARLAQCRPRRTASAQGQLFHQGTQGRQHLDHLGAHDIRRDQGLPQRLPPPRQQAGVERHAARGDQRRVPAVHLQVPRLALRPGRQPDLRPAGGASSSTSTRVATGWCACTARSGRASSSSTSPSSREQSLRDFLGPMITDLEGYPFGQMTSRWYYRSEVKANWKLYMDAFQEFYHAPVLHANQSPTAYSKAAAQAGFEAPHYRLDGPHRLVSTSGVRAWEMADEMRKPIEDICQSGLFGPWDKPDLGEMPVGLNPAKCEPVGPGFIPAVPQLRHPVLGSGLVPDLPLLADFVQHPRLRGHALLPAATHSSRTRRPGTRGGVVQGIRAAGRQHPRGDPDDDRIAGDRQVPAQRPGDPATSPAQGDRGLDRRVPVARLRRECERRCPLCCPPNSPTWNASRSGVCPANHSATPKGWRVR